jgi:NAD(P)-dependent dehydrogenase (short-subunit alcohol dehydrogenase family)
MGDSEQRTIALVTGAGSPTGIGFAVARALSVDDGADRGRRRKISYFLKALLAADQSPLSRATSSSGVGIALYAFAWFFAL